MANISNVKVRQSNVLSLSGSSVQITGSISASGDLYLGGILTAREYHTQIVTSSVIYESGSTKFGDDVADTHQFTGSVNVTGAVNVIGQVSASTFVGDGSGITGLSLGGSAVTSLTAGRNMSASASTGAVTIALSQSITSGLTTLTNVTTLGASTASFNVLSASSAEFSGSVIIYGTASLSSNPDAAYVRYEASSGSVVDKIVVFPGLYTVGQVTASVFSGAGTGLTGLSASNFSDFSGDVRKQLSGVGAITYNTSSGQISTTALTAAVTQINQGSNIVVTNGTGPTATVALTSSVTGLTNLSSSAITGSDVLIDGSLKAAGAFVVAQVTATSNYVVTALDQVVFANATSGPFSVTVPAVSAANAGRQLVVKKIDATANTVTVSGSIDGETKYELNGPYQSITLVCDGSTNWFVL